MYILYTQCLHFYIYELYMNHRRSDIYGWGVESTPINLSRLVVSQSRLKSILGDAALSHTTNGIG